MIRTPRRTRLGAVVALLAVAWLAARMSAPLYALDSQPGRDAIEAVTMIGITVGDLDRSVEFFTDVLTFERVAASGVEAGSFAGIEGNPNARARTAQLRLGDERIELTEYQSPRGRPFPADSRSNDRWFQHVAIIVRDMDQAYAWLNGRMVRHASKGPQRLPDWNRSAAGIKAFYFHDPDGHFLELLEFPPDKGDPKWRLPTGRLFLGIDHTAIVVEDTQASLRFYRDTLGFKIAGGSENYGVEQENLNNVRGAHLRITTLRAPRGPAIELLEYIHPHDGRPYPSDARANDLLHWQTRLIVHDPVGLAQRLQAAGTRFASIGSDRAEEDDWMVRDPDGHAMLLAGK